MGRNITVPSVIGPMSGVNPPIWMSGKTIIPQIAVPAASALTTTATRLYYVPIYLPHLQTFAGIKTFNQGTGDDSETYRVGIYGEAAAGGPGALLKDCGQITLNSSSALRTAASAFTNAVVGWYYLALHFNSAVAMYRISSQDTSSSGVLRSPPASQVGTLETMATSWTISRLEAFDYVDTTYAALASTAVAPTNSTNYAPNCAVYV